MSASNGAGIFSWLSAIPSLLFGQGEPGSGAPSRGIDIPLNLDTPVGNILPGTVQAAYYGPGDTGTVDIATTVNGKPAIEEYLHLDQIFARVGQAFNVGDVVGLSGGQLSGGTHPTINRPDFTFSTGPHLKYAVDVSGQAIDPSGVIAQARNSLVNSPGVALPTLGNPLQPIADMAALANKAYVFFTSGDWAKVLFGFILLMAGIVVFLLPEAKQGALLALDVAKVAS